MRASAPNFLRIDDEIRPGQVLHGQSRVQVDADALVGFVRQLAAIKSILPFRVQEIQVVWLAHLRQAVIRHGQPRLPLLFRGKSLPVQRIRHAVERVHQQAAFGHGVFGFPDAVVDFKRDHALRARLDTASLGAEIDDGVVHVARHQPSHQPPEFAGQDVGLAVHRADNVACL